MNNRAFTLVEMLGVIIVLIAISLLVFPAVESVVNKSKEVVSQTQVNTILKAAYDFSLKNTSYLPSSGETNYITLAKLKNKGLIDANLEDPKTREKYADSLVISISNVGAGYSYDKETSMMEGNYLYKIEFEKLNANLLSPSISLEDLTPNSNNEYILTLNLNGTLDSINYSAESVDGVDLTDKVEHYTTKDGIFIDSIDSSSSGIYKIYYAVVDDNGYSNLAVLNIIIADTEKPVITLPSNNTISTTVSSFNLLRDVNCTDNSGFCDITTSGSITFGTVGKYIIEYTGQDPSGNTTTVKRVITVE